MANALAKVPEGENIAELARELLQRVGDGLGCRGAGIEAFVRILEHHL